MTGVQTCALPISTPCRDLELIPEDTDKLSLVANTVVDNYAQYDYCKSIVSEWIEWYTTQKKIFDEVK